MQYEIIVSTKVRKGIIIKKVIGSARQMVRDYNQPPHPMFGHAFGGDLSNIADLLKEEYHMLCTQCKGFQQPPALKFNLIGERKADRRLEIVMNYAALKGSYQETYLSQKPVHADKPDTAIIATIQPIPAP